MVGALMYALRDAPRVLPAWRDYIAAAPDAFTPLAVFWSGPPGFPDPVVGRPILILAGVYAGLGLLATPPRNRPQLLAGMNASALAAVWGALLVLFAFVLTLGIHVALRVPNSRQAVTNTLGTVFFLSVGTLVCIYLILINPGTFEYQFLSFSLFLVVGIGGLWWVLSADRPTQALTLASTMLPIFIFYCVTNILVAQPGSEESAAPLVPFLSVAFTFGFAVAAMLVPMLSEFDVAFGRTHAQE
jgi:hypothetical protein